MKIVEQRDLLAKGPVVRSRAWARACRDVEAAIRATDWPHGSGSFTIYPEKGAKSGKGNGVNPIKLPCLKALESRKWLTECVPSIPDCPINTGDLDAMLPSKAGNIGFEWETGNISSSHRALNKLLLTIQLGGLVGGFLVVPSDKLKPWLTDRIGNIGELRPYFRLWESVPVSDGILRIIVVEHDAESFSVPRIPKGTDGRARR